MLPLIDDTKQKLGRASGARPLRRLPLARFVACASVLCWVLVVVASSPAREYGSGTTRAAAARVGPAPGQLDSIRYRYANPRWHGWPVAPLHESHYVRGGFLDVRDGYHFGIDITVDDSAPEPDAPAGRSHRVYAIDGGRLRARNNTGKCQDRRASVGNFAYWHMDPVLPVGSRVRPGQMIGWTCIGEWHLHLSESQKVNGRDIWVNPLHRGGKLTPYIDTSAPEVRDIAFFTPEQTRFVPGERRAEEAGTRLDLSEPLTGQVQLRVAVDDPQLPQGVVGEGSRLLNSIHPYEMYITISDGAGQVVFDQRSFRADVQPGSPLGGRLPLVSHYSPGTRVNKHANTCMIAGAEIDCRARMILNPLARVGNLLGVLDTSRFADGAFTMTVRASDITGNVAVASASFCVDNSAMPRQRCDDA